MERLLSRRLLSGEREEGRHTQAALASARALESWSVGFPWNEKMQTDLVDIIAEDQERWKVSLRRLRIYVCEVLHLSQICDVLQIYKKRRVR